MSKISSIQAQLNKAAGRGTAGEAKSKSAIVTSPAPAESAEMSSSPATGPKSRIGKVHVGAYLPADFKRSLRLLQAQTGEDTQTIIARALNEVFRAANVPVIEP